MPGSIPGPTPSRDRPPWWPEDEPWPPEGWGPRHWGGARRRWMQGGVDGTARGEWMGPAWWGPRRRGDMRRGFGCLIVMLATLIVSVGVLVLWLLAGLLGLASVESGLADLARPAGLVTLAVGLAALVVGIRLARGVTPRFNAMAARLEAEDATRRRLLADVSHELRTPLAVVQGNLEALLDGVYPADR